ncbi:MAG: hypothetical protein ACTSVI_01115, partial [Promethearchaeota archaeon]
RFIAEYRIKDINRMIQYIGFFIKYQMITGLIQITLLSYLTFYFIESSNYAYLTWMLLLILQKQWPGMLGIFKTILSGMQHHAKVEVFNFLQGLVVERITLIVFVLFGRWLGEKNPALGMIMGICIFTQIGNYIDDVIFGFISGYYVNKILKSYMNLSIADVFKVKIKKPVLKEMLFYGIQGSLMPILGSSVSTLTLLVYTQNISGYASWSALISIGGMFSSVIGQIGDFALSTTIAESYSNGKKKLAEFYVSYSIRWRYLFYILVGITLFSIIPYFIAIIYHFSGLTYYRGATIFFIPLLIKKLFDPLLQLPDPIMTGALHITQYNIIRAVEEVMKIFFLFFFVFTLKVQETWGISGLLFLIGFQHFIPYIIKTIICYVYVNKKIIKIKIYWKPTFIGPVLSSLPVLIITQSWYYLGFFQVVEAIGVDFTIVISMIILTLLLLFIYFPLNILIGGWDDYMLYVFSKAVKLSGPSKPVFKVILSIMKGMKKHATKIGMWNRKGWTIPYQEAHDEIRQLMLIKKNTLKKIQK